MATTVTSKGQVTIPKSVRDYLGVKPGTSVEFRRAEDGNVIIAKIGAPPPVSRLAKWVGVAGPGLSTDEIMEMTRGKIE